MIPLKNINIVYGHYGVGKTNFVLNLALDAADRGEKTTVVDMDVVNPYFRSGGYSGLLEQRGVELIATQFANSNLDLPSLPAEMYSIFSKTDRKIIIDVGGDDAGAFALGRFSAMIKQRDHQAIYLVNRFRALTHTPQEAADILSEIEQASRIKADCIINNSHLGAYTGEQEILSGFEFAEQTAALVGLPLIATTCERNLFDNLIGKIPDLRPIDIIVKPPF